MAYLLNITFYAGSSAEEDTDRGLFLMTTNETYSETQIQQIFDKVNSMLNISDEDMAEDTSLQRDISLSYFSDHGVNLHTLIQGVAEYLNINFIELSSNCGTIPSVSNYFKIVQGQV